MPTYRTLVKRLLSHETRIVEAGDEFTTTFPKVKVNGKLVDMKLGDTLICLDPPAEAGPKVARRTPSAAPADAAGDEQQAATDPPAEAGTPEGDGASPADQS